MEKHPTDRSLKRTAREDREGLGPLSEELIVSRRGTRANSFFFVRERSAAGNGPNLARRRNVLSVSRRTVRRDIIQRLI